MPPRKATPKDEHALARNRVTPLLQKEARAGDVWFVKLGAWRWVVGLPDYVVCVRGLFGAIELKHPTDIASRPSARQRRVLRAIARAGGVVATCRSEDEVRDILAAMRARRPATPRHDAPSPFDLGGKGA